MSITRNSSSSILSFKYVVNSSYNVVWGNKVNTSVLDVEQASQGIAASLEIARKIAEGKYLIPPEIDAHA